LDILSRKNNRSKGFDSDSDSDDGPPPDPDEIAPTAPLKREKKAAGEAKEVHVSARKSDDQSGLGAQGSLSAVRREMLHIIRIEEEEHWESLAFCNVTVRCLNISSLCSALTSMLWVVHSIV
jgi:DNA-directed RNA polymerase-3 subunit RPC5